MPRIPYPDPATLPESDREFLLSLPQLNISRMLALSPSMFQPMTRVFSAYLNHGLLTARQREIAILRTGHLRHSEYEVVNHIRVAKLIEMTAEEIAALEPGNDASVLNEEEQLILKFTDEVVLNGGASKETFHAMAEYLDPPRLMELTVGIGVYTLVSMICHSFEIELEEVPIANTGLEDIRRTVEKFS